MWAGGTPTAAGTRDRWVRLHEPGEHRWGEDGLKGKSKQQATTEREIPAAPGQKRRLFICEAQLWPDELLCVQKRLFLFPQARRGRRTRQNEITGDSD